MSYTVALPNGQTVEFPDSVPKDKAAEIIRQQLGSLSQPEGKRATVGGAFMGGLEGLISSMRTGVGAATGSAEEAAMAGLQRGQERAEKYGEATSLERVKQAYRDRGILPAAGEVLSQIPAAIAEQAPNIGATIGSARLGALAGSPFGPAGTLIGAGLGAFAPGALQMFGSNIERQAAEQQRAGKPLAIDVGAAAAAAPVQGALDVAATFIPLGRTVAGKVFGPRVEQLLARGAEESAEKLAKESLKSVIAKGTLVGGAAEIPTEIAQQMLERAQAGLSLTDEDALKEYGETAYSVGLLAPIGGAGRFADRSAARDVVAGRQRAEEAKAQAAAAQQAEQQRLEREQYMQTPQYLDEIAQKYDALQKRVVELTDITKRKVDSTDLAGKEAQRQARKELSEMKNTEDYMSTVQEFLAAKPRIEAAAKEKELAAQTAEAMKQPGAQGDLFGAIPTVTDRSPIGQLTTLDEQIKALDAQMAKAATPQEQQPLLNQKNALQEQMQALIPSQAEFDEARRRIEALQLDAQTKFSEAQDTDATERAVANYQRLEQAKAELEKFAPYIQKQPKAPDLGALQKRLQKRLQKARDEGDVETAAKLLPKIKELEAQPDMFGAPYQAKLFAEEEALATDMASARERAEAARQRVEQEKAALERIKAKARPEEGSAAWAVQQEKLERARADYANYERAMELQRQLKILRNLYRSEEEVAKLQDELRQISGLPMDQIQREKRANELQKQIDKQQAKVLEYRDEDERYAGPNRKEINALQLLRQAEAEMAELQNIIAANERFRDTTGVADNILADVSDERVSSLLDQLLASVEAAPTTTETTPATKALRAQTQRSQEAIDKQTAPLRQQIEALRKNPRKNKKQIAELKQQIADIEAGGMQGNIFAQLMAEPTAEGDLEKQKPTTRSRMLELNENTADAFDQLYFELEKRGEASPQVVAERRKQLERAVFTEIDFKLQSAGAPAMNRAERNQLKQELDLLVDDMLRIGITRNPDNSYELGQVAGMTVVSMPKEGSLSAEQLQAVQDELANVRNTRMSALEPRLAALTENLHQLGRLSNKTGKELEDFVEQQLQGDGPQSLRSSIASAKQKERELSALLSGYIEGKNLQLVVVPTMYAASARVRDLNAQLTVATANGDQTKIDSINKELDDIERSYTAKGSNAPLSARAFGSVKNALPVLEDQLSGIIRRFSTDLTVDESVREEVAARIQALPIEVAQDLLDRVKANQTDLNILNGYIKKAGTPKSGTPQFDALKAVTAQRDALAAEQKLLLATDNAKAEREQKGPAAAEAAAPTVQEALVGMGATPQQIGALDMRLVELRRLRQEVVDARSRQGQVGRTAKEQALLDKYAKEGPALITQYDNEIARLTRMRDSLRPAEREMQGRYAEARRAEMEATSTIDPQERAEMERQLAGIERQLENLTVATARGDIRQRLEAARDELKTKLSAQGPAPAAQARGQKQLPGVQRGAVTIVRPVSEARMSEARTEMVEARTRVETLKEALLRTGAEPQYFREIAQRLRNEVDAFEDAYEARVGTQRDQAQWDRLRLDSDKKLSQILYFEAMASSVEAQADAKAKVQNELDRANARMERTTAAYEALSERQRRYEAQQESQIGAVPGQAAAERIQAGETTGFVNYLGKSLARKPKSAESWDIKKDSKTKAPTAKEAVSSQRVQQAAAEVLERVELNTGVAELNLNQVRQQLFALTAQRAKVDETLAQVYPDSVATSTAEELQNISASVGITDTTPNDETTYALSQYETIKKMDQPLGAFNTLVQETNNATDYAAREVAAAERATEAARQKAEAAYKAEGLRKADVELDIQDEYTPERTVVVGAEEDYDNAKMALAEAKTAYLQARHAQLSLLQAFGRDLQNTQLQLTSKLADLSEKLPQAQEQVAKLTKDRDTLQAKIDKLAEADRRAIAARQLEKDKERQERNKALDEAGKARAALQRAQEGLGLPGIRLTRDTAGVVPTAVQNDIKRRIAAAETELSKLEQNPASTAEQIDKARLAIEALNTELNTVFDTVKDITTKVEPIEEGRLEGEKPVPGMRLPEAKKGPLVRPRSGNKKLIQGGVIRLRAAGMSQEAANNVTIAHYKAQLDDNPNNKKAQERFAAATKDMTPEQVVAAVEDGNRLLGSGPTLELIAKREAFRVAEQNVAKAEQALADAKKAKDPDMVVLAEDGLNIAQAQSDAAERAYTNAKALFETQYIKKERTSTKQAELEAELDAAFEQTSIPLETETVTPEKSKIDRKSGKAVFRTATTSGPGMQVDAVRRLIKRITDAWANVPTIALAENFDALPDNIKQQAIADGVQDTFPGVYDPETNTTYLVADRLHTGEDVIATLAHEITGHFGLRSIMGNDYPRIMNMLYNGNKAVREQADAKLAKNPGLGVEIAVEEVLADMAEQPPTAQSKGVLARVVAFIKNALKRLSGQTVSDDYVRQIIADARQYVVEGGQPGPGGRYVGGPVFRSKNTSPSALVGQQAGRWDTIRGNLFGLAGRVQLVDRLGAADEAFVRAQNAGVLSSLEAETAQYFMRLADMTTQAAGQFITAGPVRIVSEKIGKNVEERYQSQTGATLVRVAEHIDAADKAGLGADAEIATTVIMAGNRANATPNGWARLNAANPAGAKAEYEMYKAKLAANPAAKAAVDAAIAEYQKYNNGLLDFLVDTGFMPKYEADRLKKIPYVPFYRVENGEVQLFTGEEKPIRIGNLADNPDLKQMLGDSRTIMPLLTGAVQNTFMLTRAGLRNKGTHTTADALFKAGFASRFGKGPGPAGTSTVRFKVNGEDYFATIDTDTFGIPANLVVQGMEGIKTTIPALVKMLGVPANILRKFVTRGPAYVIRQLIRDPVNAAIVGGVDGVPVLNALKEMAKMRGGRSPSEDVLMRGLVVSSNVYTGDERDMQKFLEDISTGKGKWDKLLGMMDTLALQADAATRAVVYQDSLKKGFTTRQAEFRALEVQNFSRRGLSPSMQALSVMVPFFNAQIQGIDVLYRSLPLPWKKAQVAFADRLEIQRKIMARGTMLMVGTLAYAMMMQDDEEYLKTPPEQRYANFFVPLPGVKDPLKVPIPYEAGILFKALPEALVNVPMGDAKAKEAIKGIGMLLWQSTPGVVPLGVKPIAEAAYGQTPFGPIESQREKGLQAAERYRENTPEVLKLLGGLTGVVGVSPLMLQHFVQGYTSSLGVSLLHVLDPLLAEQGLEKATTGAAKTPFIGGLFQTTDGRFLIERAYDRMEEINQVANTYKRLASTGRTAEAEAFRQNYLTMLDMASGAGSFRQRMGEMFSQERAIRDDRRLSAEQKDRLIEQLKTAQNREAVQFYLASERTTRQ